MSDSNRKTSNGAVEQIMRNITSDMHNADGQYIQLGFTPPATPQQEPWAMPNQMSTPYISQYNMHTPEHHPYNLDHQYNQQNGPFNYLQQQPAMYNQDPYEKHVNNGNDYVYNHQEALFSSNYKAFMPQKTHNMNVPEHNYLRNHQDNISMPNISPTNQNRTPLIDNLVGNWVPNTSGTYSPFGNVPTFNTSTIFEPNQEMDNLSTNMVRQILEEPRNIEFERSIDDSLPFQFNRDTKKPRMVAEVKPMRPSYSDVLLKSAPPVSNAKNCKLETKEIKNTKKDIKKNLKGEKIQKLSLNRSNTNAEIKDMVNDKSAFIKTSERSVKDGKTNQLNRKWASLDNVTDSSNEFKSELNEGKKKQKIQEINHNKGSKIPQKKVPGKPEFNDTDSGSGKNDTINPKNITIKRGIKVNKMRNSETSANERPPGNKGRSQRNRKRENPVPFGVVGQKFKEYLMGWWKYIVKFLFWLLHLVSDVCSLSVHLSKDMGSHFYSWFKINWALFLDTSLAIVKRIRVLTWIYDKFKNEKELPEKKPNLAHSGLHNNINMPTTGEEAMKRLLACKGKDPYSILGVTPTCTDDDIKRYYKKQAFLVHPDKNQQPGAEEAFKILVHAFDMIGEPERKAAYDRGVAESAQAEQAMTELTELLVQLQQKVEAAANTIRCSACGLRHKRIKTERATYAARNCITCKINHAAREGDIWAEARCFGFLWHYYACMDGGVYDITDWAGCQKESLKHLRPDSHQVSYRIALGKTSSGPPRRHHATSTPRNENQTPDLENLLNSLYGQNGQPATEGGGGSAQNQRRKNKKTK